MFRQHALTIAAVDARRRHLAMTLVLFVAVRGARGPMKLDRQAATGGISFCDEHYSGAGARHGVSVFDRLTR